MRRNKEQGARNKERSPGLRRLIRNPLTGVILLFLLISNYVHAHDARPVVVDIREQLPGVMQFTIRAPDTVEAGNQPTLVWPAGCQVQNSDAGIGLTSGRVLCAESLYGKTLALDYPYFNPSLATFYRYAGTDGGTLTAMLTPTSGPWEVPLEPTAGNVAREYLLLGIEHIIGGLDHLLFVLGLLVIARTLRRILWTVTGFTIAHSITLTMSALGFISIPIVPVEAAIALSIVFLAHEISRDHQNSLTYRYPLIVSFSFGLLHGLGFASALGEIGLVPGEILVSLLFFNLGVEAGQIAFILAVVLLLWGLRRAFSERVAAAQVVTAQRLDLLAAYVIGIPASYWLIDRVAQFIPGF